MKTMGNSSIMEGLKDQLIGQIEALDGTTGPGAAQQKNPALAASRALHFPHAKNEEWKYSPFSLPKNSTFQLLAAQAKTAFHFRNPGLEHVYFLVFVDGAYQAALSAQNIPGIEIKKIESPQDQSLPYENNIFNHLNLATAHLSGISLKVAPKAVVDQPVVFLHLVTAAENAWVQPRIQIEAGERAEAVFAEMWQSENDNLLVFNMVTELEVKPSARVKWISFENLSRQITLVNQTRVEVREKAVFQHVVLSMGQGFVRNNLEIRIHGEAGDAHMYGLSLGNHKQHADHHTFVNHKAENTTSNQLYKGIYSGKSTGVFNGKILVDQAAQKTNAYQSSKNILLSADAKVFAKPQLEIFADDVKCSHGATIGQLDEEPVFYLRSRGLDEATAKHLLIQAFASEILMQIPDGDLKSMMEEAVLSEMQGMTALS